MKDWSAKCTHLVQEEIVMTEKAMLALVDGKPIVHPSWVDAMLNRQDPATPLPRPEAYLPEISDTMRNANVTQSDFKLNLSRQKALVGCAFFFISAKQVPLTAPIRTRLLSPGFHVQNASTFTVVPLVC
eukprot:SAG31_NODE_2707_length_5211_cov_7.051601_2_plen_129_part_00